MSYISDIQQVQNLTIKDIVRIAERYIPFKWRNNNAWAYFDDSGRTLNHGVAILETEEQCNAYLVAYGNMHYNKLKRAFDEYEFPFNLLNDGFEIYDWGCGQGIGTVSLIECLRHKGKLKKLKRITLEEPSEIARSRAIIHVKNALCDDSINLRETGKYLPSDSGDNTNSVTSINIESQCAIHIFSNILDIESVRFHTK